MRYTINDRKDQPDWCYKEQAVKKAANLFHFSISQTTAIHKRMQSALLVPTPPSEAKNSEKYDGRNLQLLHYFFPQGKIYELVLQKTSRPSLRSSKIRDPKSLEDNYYLNADHLSEVIQEIWLFDDVLTQGTTFRAMSNIIRKSWFIRQMRTWIHVGDKVAI